MSATRDDLLDDLSRDVRLCRRCTLCHERENAVPGEGRASSPLMFIGEAPGFDEDRRGRPFVGKSGRKLNGWLSDMGIDRDEVYISNVLKCRPSKNRFPENTETTVERCLSYVQREIELVEPRGVVLVGKQALLHVLLHGTGQLPPAIDPWVGPLYRRREVYGETRFAVIYHPAFILRREGDGAGYLEEDRNYAVLGAISGHVRAVQRGDAPPVVDTIDVKERRIKFQKHFDLFGANDGG